MRTEPISYQGRISLLQPALLFAALAVFLIASTASAQQTNPLASDPRAARAGGVIFRGQCASCHGADAKGISSIDAPDLTLMWAQPGMTENRVFTRIQAGIPGSIMPPHDFPDTEIWMLVSYLRSVAITGSTGEFSGEPENGERLFAAHCIECHRVGSSGGSLGPNLERITQRRSQEALLRSVREPNSHIGRSYKPIILSTTNAANVSGIIKGEDAFSIQILDSNQRLRGFAKSALLFSDRNIDSLMPAFPEGQLNNSQLDDILSYLHQQR